jgi:lysophospholipase L1-like esterase
MLFSLIFSSILPSVWGKSSIFPLDIHTQHLPASHSVIISNGVELRILPLGDSITYGSLSSDGNGYRLDLQNLLSGNTVQYIGSQHSGSMVDNANEGHPGAVISQIAQFANLSLNQLPNVVLLMAGTNDMAIPSDPSTAPDRLGSLIDEIVAAVPDAAVLVAQLTPAMNQSTEASIVTFNAAIPGIVATRANAKKVIIVDMSKYVTTSDLADDLHPNDQGYANMASAWYDGIQQAASNGWILAPQAVTGVSPRTTCSGPIQWTARGLVATGAATGDSAFASGWTSFGQVATGGVGKGSSQGSGVHLADINGDGLADYLWVDPTSGAVIAYLNGGIKSDGTSVWKSIGSIAAGVGEGAGVYFAGAHNDLKYTQANNFRYRW